MKTVTAAEMKRLEKSAAEAGLSYLQMMENAGQAAVEAILAARPGVKTAAVFCGAGNNGGDGFVAARLLHQRGVTVLLILADDKPRTHDAVTNFYLAAMRDIPMVTGALLDDSDRAFIDGADVVIDAIYGTGFHGELPLEGEICCGAFNHARGLRVSLDVPSGVACDSGEASPGAARADLTVAFHAAKPCHELNAAQCGEVIVADIGIAL